MLDPLFMLKSTTSITHYTTSTPPTTSLPLTALFRLFTFTICSSSMEGISPAVYKGIKRYWKRKQYKRIDNAGSCKNGVKLGGVGANKRKRFWRFKITPRIKFFSVSSTKKFFIRIRDAYVNMMLNVASSGGLSSGNGGGGSIGYGFGRDSAKEYDEKAIIEMYKSRMLKGPLVPRGAGKLVDGVACR